MVLLPKALSLNLNRQKGCQVVAKIAKFNIFVYYANVAPGLQPTLCNLILLHRSYFVAPAEQHKLHVLLQMEQHLLFMPHALHDIHAA